ACSGTGSTSPSSAPPASDPASWSAVSIPGSQIDAAINSLDGIANRTMSATGIPGMAIAVVRDGKTVYAKGFGVRKAGTSDPVDADTAFQIASVSKPIGASVVASVVGTKGVAWTDPATKYLTNFSLADPYVTKNATIGDYYAMRTGLPGEAGDELELFGYSREQILARLKYLPLTPFRAEYHYTNFGLTVGAQAVSQAVKTPWELLSKQRIYDPLGMTRTTSSYAEFLSMDNRATLHTKLNGVWAANKTRDPQAQSPAGGVSTSANDMAKWLAMELGNGSYQGTEVVDSAALQESRIPRITSNPPMTPQARSGQFGYGINIGTDGTGRVRYPFSGAFTVGASTNFVLLPSENLGISVFTNASPVGAPEAVTSEFMDLVETGASSRNWLDLYGKLFGARDGPTPTPPPAPSPTVAPAPTADYAGVYANPYYGPVTVKADGPGLVATLGPANFTIKLNHYDGNTFSSPALAQALSGVEIWMPSVAFTMKNGKAVSVRFEDLDANGLGTFTR
ncbi:MAG: serine hydrolase, partial [Actinomycetes bacterium]